jgi:hypothetical protein
MDSIFGNQNNTGFVSFDEIENAFKTPTQRQDYYEPKPDPTPGNDDLSRLADPDGQAFSDFERLDDDPAPQVDHEHAMRTGERIARLIDTGIDFTLSNFVARNGESYRADERDLQDIAEAWGEVSEEHNWNIGPEWTLAILYVMVYGPLVKQAVADRRMAEMEARQAAMEAQQEAMQAQLNTIQMRQAAPQPQPQPQPEKPADNGSPKPEPKPSPYAYQPATK